MLIVYAATAGVSVVKLYAAALLPGFLLAGLYIVYVIVARAHQPEARAQAAGGGGRRPVRADRLPAADLVLPARGPDHLRCSARSCSASRRRPRRRRSARWAAWSWRPPTARSPGSRLKEAVFLTARTSAMVCWLFVGSWTFSSVFSYLGGEHVVKDFVLGAQPGRRDLPDADAGHHLPARLAARVDRDHHHLRADLPAAAARTSASTRCSSASWWRSTSRPRS